MDIRHEIPITPLAWDFRALNVLNLSGAARSRIPVDMADDLEQSWALLGVAADAASGVR